MWLSRFVEDVRIHEFAGPRPISRLPDGRVNLYFRVHEGGTSGDLTVSGPRTRALYKIAHGVERVITVELKPGWSSQLLGVPAHVLTDRIAHLHDLWGGADLSAELLSAHSTPAIIERLSHALFLRAQQTVESASARLARRAVHMLETEEVRVESVAERLGVTARHLRRVFVESIGIGPKEFARTVRLQRAVKSAATSSDWGRIAVDSGYYDQAHLISEFRELVGLTPGAYAKRLA